MSTISIEKSCVKFYINPPIANKTEIYNEAVKRAYGDMARHTLHYTAQKYKGNGKVSQYNRENLKQSLANKILASENAILTVSSQKDFETLHNEICLGIIDIFTTQDTSGIIPTNSFTYGQAQKILNMTLKYVFIFYNYHFADSGKFQKELNAFNNIIPYLHTPVDSIVIEAAYSLLSVRRPTSSWSKMDKECYISYQKAIRNKLSNNNPFTWELDNYPF